ncbi:very short patch repair endonuclease [Marinobacter hydrocarbonoclasticus]|uniref:very short patch repair endonuclease n=1 Tax=Marinobacter nauticus TaxID=2743 RepID=UPI000DF3B7B7|nr:very short patch repair endonuclease [Marinobacter nauticus]MBY6193298.1 very short patch repair endonuclease [Marinobacter nauticus]MBY6214446.1 very short patch repair endonuclease [Marinobacter nauticus]
MDIVSKQKRSEMMSKIGAKNTKPELIVRQTLHSQGYRFRLHVTKLPGKPDITLRKHNTVIFVHGCFWHGHNCPLFRLPKSRTEFWRSKIEANQARDEKNIKLLRSKGWRVLIIWECALKGKDRLTREKFSASLKSWFASDADEAMITPAGIELSR